MAREAHEIYRRTLGPGHFRTALPLLTLAEIHLETEQWDTALVAARGAATILEAALPDGHHVTAVARGRMGRALLGQGKDRQALPLLRGTLETLRAAPADTERYVREIEAALDRLSG